MRPRACWNRALRHSRLDRQEAKINELRADMTKKLSQVVKSAIKDLTPEERRHFAELLRRPRHAGQIVEFLQNALSKSAVTAAFFLPARRFGTHSSY